MSTLSLRLMPLALTFAALAAPVLAQNDNPNTVVWEGEKGPGKGKHIVFIAGDHEYRGEETLPALARIMAKHYGFTDEELDFIINYDIKYRLGRDTG